MKNNEARRIPDETKTSVNLHVAPPPPPAPKEAGQQAVASTLATLMRDTPPVVTVRPRSPESAKPAPNTNGLSLSRESLIAELATRQELKKTSIRIDLLENELRPILNLISPQQAIVEKEIFAGLQQAEAIIPLTELRNKLQPLDDRIRQIRQDLAKSTNPPVINLELKDLLQREKRIKNAIEFGEKNDFTAKNFDKKVQLMQLYRHRSALEKQIQHPNTTEQLERALRIQEGETAKKFNAASTNLVGAIVRARNKQELGQTYINKFIQETTQLLQIMQDNHLPNQAPAVSSMAADIQNMKALLEEKLAAQKTAARATPPPLPAARQRATPPPLPPKRTPTAPAAAIPTPPTPTATPSTPPLPPPLPNPLSQATRVKIPVFDNNPTQADLPIPVIETPPPVTQAPSRSVPTQPQISPVGPSRTETQVGQVSVPVSTPQPGLNNAPEAVASPNPAQDTVLNAAETNLNLGQITKELQTYAQQVISQFPHQPVPADAIARWKSDVEDYLAQHGRRGDQQLLLSMMTLFDAHNKQTKTIRGRMGALKAWAQEKLARPETPEAATPPPELVPKAQVIDTFLAKYNLSEQDKILIKIAIGQSLRDLDTININQVVAKLNTLMQRRREILQQIAAAQGRPMSQEEIAEHARRDSTVLSDLSKKNFALSEEESKDLVKEAKLYGRTRDKFFQSIEKSALPSQAVADMLENNLLTSPLAIALQYSLEALENTDNNLVGTPALQKALAETDALFFGAPNVAYALKRRIEHMAKVHDSQKAAASIAAVETEPREATTQIKIPLPEVKLPLAAEAPEPSQDTPTTTIEAHATDPRDAIFKADPDTAFSEAIHFLEADGATDIANKLADLNNKIEQLFKFAYENFDGIHKNSIKGYFKMIDSILGEKYKDIANALYRKLHQRLYVYNTTTAGEIEEGIDEDVAARNVPVSPSIAANDDEEIPRPRSTLQQVDNRLGEEARILHFQTLETAAISAMTNETEPYQILDKLMDVYRNEPNIIDKLKAIKTALPQVDVSGTKHQVTFSEAYLIGKKIDSIPNISSTLNGLLIRKMGAVLDKWNTEASQQSASGEYQQAA